MMTNMLGAGIAGSAGLIDLANRDKLMRRPGEKKEVIGKSSFAWCMANRMGSYESSVREAKERLFTSCFEAIRTRKQATNEVKPSNILEVGVGPGPNMPMYSKMLESGDRVWGVDANAYMGEYASQSAKAAGVPFEFMEGDAQRLPFQDNSFDAVVVSHVLCSVSDPIKAIREISRVLVPGGVFLFWEHIGAWEDKPMLRMQQDVLDPLQQVFFQGCHLNRDSLAAIERSKTFESIDARKFYIGDRSPYFDTYRHINACVFMYINITVFIYMHRMLLSPHAAGLAFKSKAS